MHIDSRLTQHDIKDTLHKDLTQLSQHASSEYKPWWPVRLAFCFRLESFLRSTTPSVTMSFGRPLFEVPSPETDCNGTDPSTD